MTKENKCQISDFFNLIENNSFEKSKKLPNDFIKIQQDDTINNMFTNYDIYLNKVY